MTTIDVIIEHWAAGRVLVRDRKETGIGSIGATEAEAIGYYLINHGDRHGVALKAEPVKGGAL